MESLKGWDCLGGSGKYFRVTEWVFRSTAGKDVNWMNISPNAAQLF
jgi:hypothetical protein